RRRAAQTGLALAGEADAGTVLDALRDVHLQRFLAVDAARPVAGAAGLVDHLSGAMAGGAGALDGEEALLGAHAAAAVAGLAADRLGAALGAAAVAGVARNGARHPDLRRLAAERVLESNLHVVAKVGTPRRLAAAAPAHEIAEHL